MVLMLLIALFAARKRIKRFIIVKVLHRRLLALDEDRFGSSKLDHYAHTHYSYERKTPNRFTEPITDEPGYLTMEMLEEVRRQQLRPEVEIMHPDEYRRRFGDIHPDVEG